MTAAVESSPPATATTLVIDSATDACSVALFAGDTLVAGDFRVLGRGHAEALVPMIATLPGKGRADRIAVALGPGSFTGVRVGLAAARALAFAWGAELVGYPTLALIAAMARASQGESPMAVVMTGGHGEWFVETFGRDGSTNRALASMRPADVAASIEEHLVVGNQANALVDARGHGHAMPVWPDARSFALLRPASILSGTQPLYGRSPDAKLPAGAA